MPSKLTNSNSIFAKEEKAEDQLQSFESRAEEALEIIKNTN